jgi:hypothetical protein
VFTGLSPHFYGIKYALSAVFISFILLAIFGWVSALISQSTKATMRRRVCSASDISGKTVYPNSTFEVRV